MCSRWGLEAGGSIQSSVEMDSQSLTPYHWVISVVQLLFLVRRHSKCYRVRPEMRASGPLGWLGIMEKPCLVRYLEQSRGKPRDVV